MIKRVPRLPVRLPNGTLRWPHAALCRYVWELEHDPRGHLLRPCDNLTHGVNSYPGPYTASRTPSEDPK